MSKKFSFNPDDPKGMSTQLTGLFTEMQEGFADLLKNVPETMRADLAGIKAKIDSALVSLQNRPSEQVPAAMDAGSMLRYACYSLQSLNDAYQGTMQALNRMLNENTQVKAEYQGLDGRIKAGELLTKEQVEERVAAARQEEAARYQKLGARRTELLALELPAPGDELLEGEEDAFKARKDEAVRRHGELKPTGALTELNGVEVAALLYGPKDDFERTLKLAKKLTPGSGGGDEGRQPEPLAGGSGGDGRKRTVIC